MASNTIYALSTYFAKSAIAIIRVSGESAKNSLLKLSGLSSPTPFKFHLVTLKNFNNDIIDKPLIVYFPKNNSYTGEDIVEYHIHGSIAVIKELLSVLSSMDDHRLAYPGEFTRRALENNKMNLLEVEGLADLIESETLLQKKHAFQSITGKTYNRYNVWLDIIKDNLSLLEASIDFSDEDLPLNLTKDVNKNITNLINLIEIESNKYNGVTKLKHGIKVAIIGATNVGKSTLINYLSKDDISITSNIPGTTRDAVSIALDFNGFPIIITDTAGIRITEDYVENLGIKKSILKANESDLKLIVLDAEHFSSNLIDMKDFLKDDFILIINKIDLVNNEKKLLILNKLKEKNYYAFLISLKNDIGLDELNKSLTEKFSIISNTNNELPIIINERHYHIIKELLVNLKESINSEDVIIKTMFLRNSMNELGKILGLNNIEDILDRIFSKFCIGK